MLRPDSLQHTQINSRRYLVSLSITNLEAVHITAADISESPGKIDAGTFCSDNYGTLMIG